MHEFCDIAAFDIPQVDGLDESSGAGGCPIGGVIVSRRDRSLCVEDFRHILDEVMAVKVDSIILNQNQ